ncbi:hypothetical protein PO909_029955 [Leuciscus waleckii]
MEPVESVSGREPRVTLRRYTGMTISRLVTEGDSQPSEDDSQDNITQISGCSPLQKSPQRLVIRSDPESDDLEVQPVRRKSTDKQCDNRLIIRSDPESDDLEVQPVRRKSTDKQCVNRLIIRSDPESDDLEVQPVRQSSTDKQCVNSSSGESRSTPARHSVPPSVRSSGKKTHNSRRVVVSSDEECEDPPSDRQTAGQEPHHSSVNDPECVLERAPPQSSTPARHSRATRSNHSESEVHSTRPQVRSSPADSRSSSSGKRRAKRARWQDASGIQEDWSDEESLFSAASGPSRKKKYTKKTVDSAGVGLAER